jgi:hypothetical protein
MLRGKISDREPWYTFRKPVQICAPEKNTREAQIEKFTAANRDCLTFGNVTYIDHTSADIDCMPKLASIENLRCQLSIGTNFIIVRPISATV